jgi:tetratricopeptide (TPR) repeat protein
VAESTERRNRWIISVFMVVALLAFVGISLAPLLSGMFQGGSSPTVANSPTPGASATPAAKKEDLEAQAKGYELVLQREPENQTALKGLLETRLALADVKGAITPLEKLAKLNPNETLYAVLLAQAKQQTGDREGAAQTYRQVLTTHPGDIQALNGLTSLLLQQNRPESAISLLQDTLKAAPQANQVQPNSIDVTSVQVLLGGVYANQKRYEEAIAIYDEAAKGSQQDFRPIYGKAVVLKEQGKIEQAKPLFTKAAELAPAKYRDQINQTATGITPGATTPAAPSATTTTPTSPAASPAPASPAPAAPKN